MGGVEHDSFLPQVKICNTRIVCIGPFYLMYVLHVEASM